jgi:hypothetical protein
VEGPSVQAGKSRLWELELAWLIEDLLVRRSLKENSFFSLRTLRGSVLSR